MLKIVERTQVEQEMPWWAKQRDVQLERARAYYSRRNARRALLRELRQAAVVAACERADAVADGQPWAGRYVSAYVADARALGVEIRG